MKLDKWYYENDPDRRYEESNSLSDLDFYIHGLEKMLGKGVRDSSRSTTMRSINHSVSIATSFQTKETVEGCDTYWYHQRVFRKSDNKSVFYEAQYLFSHAREPKHVALYYHERSR